MELLTVKNESVYSVADPIAPLTNPLGQRPSSDTVSVGAAALLGEDAASANVGSVGVESQNFKNYVFMAMVAFLIWKYGRKVLNGS